MQGISFFHSYQEREVTKEAPSFRQGQIFYGKVLFIAPEGQALIQLGGRKLAAKVEAPLDIQKDYWFQVVKSDGTIQLKLLGSDLETGSILPSVSKKQTGFVQTFIEGMKKWDLPIMPEWLGKAGEWLEASGNLQKGLEVMRWMIAKNLPPQEEIYFGLLSFHKGESLSELMKQVSENLGREGLTHLPLYSDLENWRSLGMGKIDWTNPDSVQVGFKQLLTLLGFPMGKEKTDANSPSNLVSDLSRYLSGNEGQVGKKSAIELWQRLIGTKVLKQDTSSLLQWTVEIPIPLPEKRIDLTVEWRGRKKDQDKLDEDFCTIMLLLDLPNMGPTAVQINVQNRIVSLTIQSKAEKLEQIGNPFIERLKDGLRKLDYHLTTVKYEQKREISVTEKKHKIPSIQRVDVKI